MQGYQYTKDTPSFEKALHTQTRDRLTILLSSVCVFLLLAMCLLFIGSRGASLCSVDFVSYSKETVTCRDVQALYHCGGVPVRLAVVLQTPQEGYVRFSTSCKWTPPRVEIRVLVAFVALLSLYHGLVGLYAQSVGDLKTFAKTSPTAIALLVIGNAGRHRCGRPVFVSRIGPV